MSIIIPLDETGVTIGPASFGHFYGTAEFDEGNICSITVQPADNSPGKDITLNIEDLIRERAALDAKFGPMTLGKWCSEGREFMRKWALLMSLADTLERTHREDIESDERGGHNYRNRASEYGPSQAERL